MSMFKQRGYKKYTLGVFTTKFIQITSQTCVFI